MSAFTKPFDTISELIGDLAYLRTEAGIAELPQRFRDTSNDAFRKASRLLDELTDARLDEQAERVQALRDHPFYMSDTNSEIRAVLERLSTYVDKLVEESEKSDSACGQVTRVALRAVSRQIEAQHMKARGRGK